MITPKIDVSSLKDMNFNNFGCTKHMTVISLVLNCSNFRRFSAPPIRIPKIIHRDPDFSFVLVALRLGTHRYTMQITKNDFCEDVQCLRMPIPGILHRFRCICKHLTLIRQHGSESFIDYDFWPRPEFEQRTNFL